MNKNRLEAFSDGVLAIIVTIMILELKIPQSSDWKALLPIWPKFLSYIMSFLMVWIYWNNHHHLFQTVKKVNGNILMANGLLLFLLSLLPFATAWMGETHFDSHPVILMGLVLLLCATAYEVLVKTLLKAHPSHHVLREALGEDWKGKFSKIFYLIGMIASFWYPHIGFLCYLIVALLWIIPDRRVERIFNEKD